MNAEDVRELAEKHLENYSITDHGGTECLKTKDGQILAYPTDRTFSEAFAIGVKRWFRRLGILMSLALLAYMLYAGTLMPARASSQNLYIPVVQMGGDYTNSWPCMEPGVCDGDSHASGK